MRSRRRWAATSATRPSLPRPACCTPTGPRRARSPRIWSVSRPAGDGWVLARLREAAQAAMESGAPQAAAGLLDRALAEPPPPAQRVGVLREAARAEASAGRETACVRLEEALRLVAEPRERAEIALEVAEAYAALFRWVDAVDVIERALAELGEADEALAARLEGELVVCGLHDARRAARVAPVLGPPRRSPAGDRGEALAVAQGMATVAGRPAGGRDRGARWSRRWRAPDPRSENWDTRAALLWVLVAAERFGDGRGRARADARPRSTAPVRRAAWWRPTARSACSSCGSARCRRPTRRPGSRCACCRRVTSRRGSAFAATVLADVAVEAGELDEAQALLDLLPQAGLARGRRHGAHPGGPRTAAAGPGPRRRGAGRLPRPAGRCSAPTCGACAIRETGTCTRAPAPRSRCCGWASAQRACELADAELADVRVFGAPRALGIALRVAGLARGGTEGLALLGESVAAL